MSYPFILHATPAVGNLLASDAESIYLAALLQLVVPGRWAIQQGDYGSNGGKLPYITHLDRIVRTRHLDSLPAWSDIDDDKVEAKIWTSYMKQSLTDLVNHTLYSLPPNYRLIGPSQANSLGAVERHYIPQRIRAIHKVRLEHVGLWGLGGLHDGEEKRSEQDEVVAPGGTTIPRGWAGWGAGKEIEKRKRAFGEEELVRRARVVLDILARRVGEGYFTGDKLTTPDLMLFAHLTLLLTPDWPNPLLSNLLKSSYPRLVAHHDRIRDQLFPDWTVPRIEANPAQSWSDSIRNWSWSASAGSDGPGLEKRKKSETEKRFERGRWIWFASAAVAMVGYLLASGVVKVEFGDEEEEVEVEDEEIEEEILIIDDDEDEDSDDE